MLSDVWFCMKVVIISVRNTIAPRRGGEQVRPRGMEQSEG